MRIKFDQRLTIELIMISLLTIWWVYIVYDLGLEASREQYNQVETIYRHGSVSDELRAIIEESVSDDRLTRLEYYNIVRKGDRNDWY